MYCKSRTYDWFCDQGCKRIPVGTRSRRARFLAIRSQPWSRSAPRGTFCLSWKRGMKRTVRTASVRMILRTTSISISVNAERRLTRGENWVGMELVSPGPHTHAEAVNIILGIAGPSRQVHGIMEQSRRKRRHRQRRQLLRRRQTHELIDRALVVEGRVRRRAGGSNHGNGVVRRWLVAVAAADVDGMKHLLKRPYALPAPIGGRVVPGRVHQQAFRVQRVRDELAARGRVGIASCDLAPDWPAIKHQRPTPSIDDGFQAGHRSVECPRIGFFDGGQSVLIKRRYPFPGL